MRDARQHLVEYNRPQMREIEFRDQPEIFDRPQAERMSKRLLRMSDGGIDQLLESAP